MNKSDGSIIITTELDNKKLEKQLEQLEKQQAKLKDQKLKLDLDNSKALNNLKKVDNKLEVLNAKIAEFESNNNPSVRAESSEYQQMINQREELNAKGEEYLQQLDLIKAKQSDINQSLKSNEISINIIKERLNGINIHSVEGLKNGFDKLLKSAKRLAMGIIGVRAAYSLVRKMASSYLADNEETANRINNIWTGLGVVMGNIIEGIVNLLKKAVTAILYFASVLTNVNYIAKANEAILRKQTKATAGLRKEQNKLNASFDEAEVLQDNSNANSGITAGGAVELFDVEELGNAKKIIEDLGIKLRPVWEIIKGIVQFSLEHPDVIMGILGGVALINFLSKIIGIAGAGATGTGLAGILGALGAIAAIGAIVILINIVSNINEEAKELANQMDKMNEDGKKIHDDFLKNETDINKILTNSNIKRSSALDLLRQQNTYGGLLKNTEGSTLETLKETSRQIGGNIQKEIELWNVTGKNKEEQEKIKQEIYDQYQYNLQVIEALKKRGKDTSEIEELNKELISEYATMGGKIETANGKMTLLKKNSKVTVEMDLDTKKAEKKKNSFWNTFTEPFRDLFSGIGAMFSSGKSKNSAKGSIIYPKLAMGGIVNMPGRGIPYGGATIAERGAEAILPLTDSQQMELLGEAIGKFVTINATIPVYAYNRQVDRQIQKIQNQQDMVMNR